MHMHMWVGGGAEREGQADFLLSQELKSWPELKPRVGRSAAGASQGPPCCGFYDALVIPPPRPRAASCPGSFSFLIGWLLQEYQAKLCFLTKCCLLGLREQNFPLSPWGRLAIKGNYICLLFPIYGKKNNRILIIILNRVFKHAHTLNSWVINNF